MKKIYIAGPDVFELNSLDIGKKYSNLCNDYGFEGLYPLDNIVDFNQSKHKIAKDIYEANVSLITKSDIVIANLNLFRGKEADSGTIWECGYAHAIGKKVYGYMDNTSDYIDKFSEDEKKLKNSKFLDNQSREIENFSLPINLMIACSCIDIIEGSFEDVLKKVSLI